MTKQLTPALFIKRGQRGRFNSISQAVELAKEHAKRRGMRNPAGYAVVQCTRGYEVADPNTLCQKDLTIKMRYSWQFGAWVSNLNERTTEEEIP